MIKPNELRINNWVTHNNPNLAPKYRRVLSITRRGINAFQEDNEVPCIQFETLEPIPLTPEILLKAGFEIPEKGMTIFKDKTGRLPSYLGSTTDEMLEFYYVGVHPEIDVKYLHQLQNLYFALTGEELNIEL